MARMKKEHSMHPKVKHHMEQAHKATKKAEHHIQQAHAHAKTGDSKGAGMKPTGKLKYGKSR